MGVYNIAIYQRSYIYAYKMVSLCIIYIHYTYIVKNIQTHLI